MLLDPPWIGIKEFASACLQRVIAKYSLFWGLISILFALCQVLDCDFDNSTFCGWANENSGKAKFNWTIRSGQTPSWGTGPLSDVSGISFILQSTPLLSLTVRRVHFSFKGDRFSLR